MEPTYALAVGVDFEWCIVSPHDSNYMVCGREHPFMPVGDGPRRVHEVCVRQWRAIVRPKAAAAREAA
jgi:hypothetical protein